MQKGTSDFNLLMPEAVSSMNLIKGPTSALYGNFAMSGILNVRTLEKMDGTNIWLSGGLYGKFNGTLLTGFDNSGNSGVFGVRAIHEDGWRPNSSYDVEQGHARFVQNLSPVATLDAGVELYATNWDSPGRLPKLNSISAITVSLQTRPTGDSSDMRRNASAFAFRRTLSCFGGQRSTRRRDDGSYISRLLLKEELPKVPENQTEEEDTRYGFGGTSAVTWVLPAARR